MNIDTNTVLYILAPLALAGVRWICISVLEELCYRAENDGVIDMRDRVYPKALKALKAISPKHCKHVEAELLRRIDEKVNPDDQNPPD